MDFSTSPYYSTAVAAATSFGVPVGLFTAQIGQESGFDPSAQNGNAYGIAQFMPGTAAQYGVNRADPTSSLYGAAKYDADLYSQYGSWQTALQKYGTTANGNGPQVAAIAGALDAASSGWNAIPFVGPAIAGLTNSSGGSGGVLSGVADLLSIVTNVPRMVSVIIGLILLIAGLFLLGVRPAVQLVEKTGIPIE